LVDKAKVSGYIESAMQTVQVFNVTKRIVIARQAKVADTPGKRIKGLLGRKGLAADEALILSPCASIHTFFMRFAIDVLFLDKNKRIIKAIQNMLPNRLSSLVWASKVTIELPAGKISQTNTRVGDIIELRG